MNVRPLVLALCLLAGTLDARQAADPDWGAMLDAADQWARENLDPEVLKAFESGERDQIEAVLKKIHDEFAGDYVLDLAALKDGAQAILPLLERYQETAPYAVWLRTRLDYFEVADDFRRERAPSQPLTENPSFKKQEEIWIPKVAQRPWPKAARELVPRLKPVFANLKVPEELVWIAEVESSFDPRARSPEGATGLFQLMPATAARFGLKTRLPDERLKPEPAAQAAARYLSFLSSRFRDWRLAVAAYNCGEGRVEKLLAARKAKTYEAIATQLPAETQLYVPKVQATLLRREGRRLETLPLPAIKPSK